MQDFAAARAALVAHLGKEINDQRVLEAMARVPRERFLPEALRGAAYENAPQPIGHDQTISQPYIIALMTQELGLTGKEKVLEIGTGSGYQTAILAELARRVISVERVPELAAGAGQVLDELGYKNIEIHAAGETLGRPEQAPYDAILVTAAAPSIPQELIDQLTEGGTMVIPAGPRLVQELCKITRHHTGNVTRNLGGCRFVSLIGKNAWQN